MSRDERTHPTLGPLTRDAFLGGRLHLFQPRRGHRAGFESVLLGAAAPARAGETLIDLGAGVGTAGLCAATRVSGLRLRLVERHAGLADLARENAVAAGVSAEIVVADATARPAVLETAGLMQHEGDHVICNPPFRETDRGTPSPDGLKAAAHREALAAYPCWLRTALTLTRHHGTLTLILPPDLLPTTLAWAEGRIGALKVLPVSHAPDRPAVRMLVHGIRARLTPMRLLPFLTLKDRAGHDDPVASAILRGGAPLAL